MRVIYHASAYLLFIVVPLELNEVVIRRLTVKMAFSKRLVYMR